MGPDILDAVPVADARAVLVTGVTALIGAEPHAAGLALLVARAVSGSSIQISAPDLWGSDRRAGTGAPVRRTMRSAARGRRRSSARLLGQEGREGQDGWRLDRRERERRELARRASALGPREVVVRSAASIGVLAGGSWTALEIRRDAAVDPIGAGDAFNAGYIAVRLRGGHDRRGASSRRALRRGGHDVAQRYGGVSSWA